jgi:hypothetical protein
MTPYETPIAYPQRQSQAHSRRKWHEVRDINDLLKQFRQMQSDEPDGEGRFPKIPGLTGLR